MKIAIVILNWNGQQLLEQFLPSICKYNTDFSDIYVADNASTDTSIKFIQEKYPEIKIIRNKDNFGYAKGYNEALQHVNSDIYCLLNSDVEVTENWLTPIYQTFTREPKTAIIQPALLDYKNKNKYEYAGAGGGFIDNLGYPYCRGRVFNELEFIDSKYNNSKIFWASGACLFVRKSIFEELNGLDEGFFAHQEEIDLCWRAQNNGYDIKYVSDSIVYHVGGATLKEGNPKKTYLNFRNNLLMMVKNAPAKNLFFIIPIRLVLDGIAGIRFITENKFRHTLAILKAHFSFYRLFFKYLKKRKETKQKIPFYLHKYIVWQFFITGRKKFTDLQ